MKKQIEEVQNYFINKITACNFELLQIKESLTGWCDLEIMIDGEYCFCLMILVVSEVELISCSGTMRLNIPKNRTKNLLEFIKQSVDKMKSDKIAELQQQIKQLQA